MTDDGLTIVLVGCGSAKIDEPAPARDLYSSNYFKLKRAYAEAVGDAWYILSAEHGLVAPDEILEPYDTTMTDVEPREWEKQVREELPQAGVETAIVLAGSDYLEDTTLGDTLDMWYPEYEAPTAGKRIGERMQWLADVLEELDDQEPDAPRPDLVEDVAESITVRDAPARDPEPPEELPAYLADPVDRQSAETLRLLAHYALERAAYLDRDLDVEEIDVGDDEQLVDVSSSTSGSGTIVSKKVPCGKSSCSTCPHGPYDYRVYRDGSKVVHEYLGKTEE